MEEEEEEEATKYKEQLYKQHKRHKGHIKWHFNTTQTMIHNYNYNNTHTKHNKTNKPFRVRTKQISQVMKNHLTKVFPVLSTVYLCTIDPNSELDSIVVFAMDVLCPLWGFSTAMWSSSMDCVWFCHSKKEEEEGLTFLLYTHTHIHK